MNNSASRIKELVELISYHQRLYYNGEPEISDEEFDMLWDELSRLDPTNSILKKVGEDSSNVKVQHIMPMGSQSKVTTNELLSSWAIEQKIDEFVVQHKLDGSSLEMQYENGVLVKAVTRGNGIIGDDVTINAKSMNGVPSILPVTFSGGVRGEVLMYKETREKVFPDKANCRNAANGIMKRKDDINAKYLIVICYDVVPKGVYDLETHTINKSKFLLPFSDEVSKIMWLKSVGFNTVDVDVFNKIEDVFKYRDSLVKNRDKLPYIIDGVVIKSKKVNPYDMIKARPEKQIAFKFPLENVSSPIIDVEWSECGVTYTPIGIISPVQIAGTTVQRANLCNPNMIRDLGIKIGSTVVVVKRGEIIPKIEYVLSTPPDAKDIVIPTHCESCGSELINEGTSLYCPNSICPKRTKHRLEKWIDVVDIRDFGPATVETLFNAGRVRSIKDIYTLTEEELVSYGFGKKISNKLILSIHKNTTITLSQFIAGFDIEGIGITLMDKLVDIGIDDIAKLSRCKILDFTKANGFSDIMARRLYDGIELLSSEMEELLKLNIIKFKMKIKVDDTLKDKVFCFTGEMHSMTRDDAAVKVKSHGGRTTSTVTKETTYLVTNDTESGSKKNELAKKCGVKIINEYEFVTMI